MKNMKMMMVIMFLIVIVGLVYAFQGIGMHNRVPGEEAKFHALQESYFAQSKAVRDGAKTNSQLNRDLAQIKNYPSTLLELKLVGIGRILTGIFAVLFAILMALMAMPIRLGKILKEHNQ